MFDFIWLKKMKIKTKIEWHTGTQLPNKQVSYDNFNRMENAIEKSDGIKRMEKRSMD